MLLTAIVLVLGFIRSVRRKSNESLELSLYKSKFHREKMEKLNYIGLCAKLNAENYRLKTEIQTAMYMYGHKNNNNEISEHLPRLIQLCHPDKHDNSEASIVATQWLLKQRDK